MIDYKQQALHRLQIAATRLRFGRMKRHNKQRLEKIITNLWEDMQKSIDLWHPSD